MEREWECRNLICERQLCSWDVGFITWYSCESSDFSMIVERRPLLANTISLFSFSRYVITTQSFGSAFCISFLQISSSFAIVHLSLSFNFLSVWQQWGMALWLLQKQISEREREREICILSLSWYMTDLNMFLSLFIYYHTISYISIS